MIFGQVPADFLGSEEFLHFVKIKIIEIGGFGKSDTSEGGKNIEYDLNTVIEVSMV